LKEIWGDRRSSFLPEVEPGEKDKTLDIEFILHLDMGIGDDFFGFETRDRRDVSKQGF